MPANRPHVRRLLVATLAVTTTLLGAAPALASVAGPDVASYQHPNGKAISWAAVKAGGHAFVFIKATEGTTYRNPYFTSDWKGSGAAGLDHAAYHFARPSSAAGSAAAQATYFARTIGSQKLRGTLPPVLDLEVTGGLKPAALRTWTATFLAKVRALTGRTPMLYTYVSFWRTAMGNSTAFTAYPLWIAEYGVSAPVHIGGWKTWTFWQYTSTSTVAGITGKSDMSVFNGSAAALARLANGAAAPSPVTSPTPSPTPTPAPAPAPTPGRGSGGSGGSSGTTSPAVVSISAPPVAAPGQTFTVSGRVTAGGVASAGATVQVLGRLAGHDGWWPLATVSSDRSGAWAIQLRAPSSAQFRAVLPGAQTSSDVVTVTIDGGSGWGH